MLKIENVGTVGKMVDRWIGRFFFLLLLSLPFTRRFNKIFRSFFESIIPSDVTLPQCFDWHYGVYISDFAFVLLLVALIAWRKLQGNLWVKTPAQVFLSLFLITVFISILFSSTPHYPIHYFRYVHLLLPCLLFYGISGGAILSDRKALFAQLTKAVVIMAVFQSLLCIAQYFTQHSVGFKYLGEISLTSRHATISSIIVSDGSLTLFDHWLTPGAPKAIIRAVGTLFSPNICGGFLVFSLLFSYIVFLKAIKKKWISLAIFLQVTALFLTFSRAALYSWVIATALWFFFLKLREKRLSFLVLGSTAFCLTLFYPQLSDRGGVVSYTAIARESDLMRLDYQQVATSIIKDHPLLGIGFDHYNIDGYDYAQKLAFGKNFVFSFVHNIFIYIGAESGLLGLAFFLLFIGAVIKQGWAVRKEVEGAALLALFISFIFLGSCDAYLYMWQIGRFIFFVTAAGLVFLAPRKPAAARITVAN